MKVSIPVAKGNETSKNGTMGETMNRIITEQNPEACYLFEEGGARTCLLVVNLKSESEIPKYAEPWFLAFDAKVEFHPAMIPADLKNAASDIAAVVAKYG